MALGGRLAGLLWTVCAACVRVGKFRLLHMGGSHRAQEAEVWLAGGSMGLL